MVGGIGWESRVLIFGTWFLYASCGQFGRRGTVARLRIWSSLEMLWLLFFSRTLFDWARGWGSTHCISLPAFLYSLRIS